MDMTVFLRFPFHCYYHFLMDPALVCAISISISLAISISISVSQVGNSARDLDCESDTHGKIQEVLGLEDHLGPGVCFGNCCVWMTCPLTFLGAEPSALPSSVPPFAVWWYGLVIAGAWAHFVQRFLCNGVWCRVWSWLAGGTSVRFHTNWFEKSLV